MVGATCPIAFDDEHVVYLAYYDIEDNVALVRCDHYFKFRIGMPRKDQISRGCIAA